MALSDSQKRIISAGKLTCRLAHVENIQALSMGLMALPCREGAGLEMIGGWTGGKKVDDGSVTRSSEP